MSPKKGRRVRKIEVPTDSVPEFELGNTAVDMQEMRQEREARERDEEAIVNFVKDHEELYDKTNEQGQSE